MSDVAIAHLEQRAAQRGLPVRARRADLSVEPLPAGPYEVVVNTFFLERRLFEQMRRALAPGGLLLVVTFLPAPSANAAHSLEPGELSRTFADLEILAYREGPPLPGDRPRASLIARDPTSAGLDSETE